MAYVKQNFSDGEILTAENLIKLEEGIIANEIPCMTGEGEPTVTTKGEAGCLYMDVLSGEVYKCTGISEDGYIWEIFASSSLEIGDNNIVGRKGYYYSHIDTVNKQIYLTIEQSMPQMGAGVFDESFETPAYEVGDLFSIVNSAKYEHTATISAIDHNVITYEGDLPFTDIVDATDGGQYELEADDYSFSVPAKADVGVVTVKLIGFAVGNGVVAAGNESAGFGRRLLVLGDYGLGTGYRNTVGYCSIVGGTNNNIIANYSLVSGAENTTEGLPTSVIIGGKSHVVKGSYGVTVGQGNTVEANKNFVGGAGNNVSGDENLVVGGSNKVTSARNIVGGTDNEITAQRNLVVGQSNKVSNNHNVVGGTSNVVSNNYNIVGGTLNVVSGAGNIVGGISHKTLTGSNNTISGENLTVSGNKNTISGGGNTVSTDLNAVSGDANTVNGTANIMGGRSNKVQTRSNLIVGRSNEVNGTNSDGHGENIVGGFDNTVGGHRNLVVGKTRTVNGTDNVVGGVGGSVDGSASIVSGENNVVSGNNEGKARHIVAGSNNTVSDIENIVAGEGNTITSARCIVSGQGNIVSKKHSMVGGTRNTVNSENGLTYGTGNNNTNNNALVGGAYSNPSKNALLTLGNGSNGAFSNAFEVFNDGSAVFGNNIVGRKGYYYSHIDLANKKIYLTTTQPTKDTLPVIGNGVIDTSFETPVYTIGEKFSIVNNSKYENVATIISIENNVVTYDEVLPFTAIVDATDGGQYELDNDDYSFSVINQSDIGKCELKHKALCSGASNRAAGNECLAIGRGSIAYGDYSLTAGYRNNVGYASFASGKQNIVGMQSMGYGYNNDASGADALVGGRNSFAMATSSVAIGEGVRATNSQAVAFGNGTTASGINSMAIGDSTVASGKNSVAIGTKSQATSLNSLAIGAVADTDQGNGSPTCANGDQSLAVGSGTKTEAQFSAAIGYAAVAGEKCQLVVGKYNVISPLNSGELFVVGNGGKSKRSNAFKVTSNSSGCSITIGNTTLTEAQLQKIINLIDTTNNLALEGF